MIHKNILKLSILFLIYKLTIFFMLSLVEYLNEKLIISTNQHHKIQYDETNIADEYSKIYSKDPAIYNVTINKIPVDKKFFTELFNIVTINNININNIPNSNNYLTRFSFNVQGLGDIIFNFFVYEGYFSALHIDGLLKKQQTIVKSVLTNNNYQWYDKRIYPISSFAHNFFISDSIFINSNDVDELFDIIHNITKALYSGPVPNWTIGPGEVIPGWTIDDIRKRYDKIFDDIKIIKRSGNVKLGHLRQRGIDSSYENSTFRIDVNIKYRHGIMIGRRVDNSSSSGNNFVLKLTSDEAFDELDRKLRNKGYTV